MNLIFQAVLSISIASSLTIPTDTLSTDCTFGCLEIGSPVCASNGITYGNACELAADACSHPQKKIKFVSHGQCECNKDCSDVFSPVCGSNNVTYHNKCQLEVQSCRSFDGIQIKSEGPCPGDENKGPFYICQLPLEVGSLPLAQFPRFYFNSNAGECQPFIYRGIAGNENNFDSLSACQEKCQPDVCSLKKDSGPCEGLAIKWYHDSALSDCFEFEYGLCGGNGNRFDSKEECQSKCKKI